MSERIWRGARAELWRQEAEDDAVGVLPRGIDPSDLPPLEMEWRLALYMNGKRFISATYLGFATEAGHVADEELEELFGTHPALDPRDSN